MNTPSSLENIVLQESYVLDISKTAKDVIFVMEFLFANGQTPAGRLIFPDVEAEEWLTDKGELTSLNQLREDARRYYGGPEERPDWGTINSILYEDGRWVLSGDWGSCRLQSHSTPKVVMDEDASLVSGSLAKT